MRRMTKKINSFFTYNLTEISFKLYDLSEKIWPSDDLTDEEIDKGNVITFFAGKLNNLGLKFDFDDCFGYIKDENKIYDNLNNLFEKINEKIEKDKISIREIWDKTGLSKRKIKKIINNDYKINLCDLVLVIDYLDIKINIDVYDFFNK